MGANHLTLAIPVPVCCANRNSQHFGGGTPKLLQGCCKRKALQWLMYFRSATLQHLQHLQSAFTCTRACARPRARAHGVLQVLQCCRIHISIEYQWISLATPLQHFAGPARKVLQRSKLGLRFDPFRALWRHRLNQSGALATCSGASPRADRIKYSRIFNVLGGVA